MASDITLASNALLRIGANEISSFDEGGASGVVANNLLEPTIRSVLSEHRWRFASAKRQLARLSAVPLNEYRYGFQLPTDSLVIYRVYRGGDYEIYGDKLYSDDEAVAIDYVFRVASEKFPPYFQLAIEYKLAAEFAIAVTDNRTMAEMYEQKYMEQLKKARFMDSQGRPNRAIQNFDYIAIRG